MTIYNDTNHIANYPNEFLKYIKSIFAPGVGLLVKGDIIEIKVHASVDSITIIKLKDSEPIWARTTEFIGWIDIARKYNFQLIDKIDIGYITGRTTSPSTVDDKKLERDYYVLIIKIL